MVLHIRTKKCQRLPDCKTYRYVSRRRTTSTSSSSRRSYRKTTSPDQTPKTRNRLTPAPTIQFYLRWGLCISSTCSNSRWPSGITYWQMVVYGNCTSRSVFPELYSRPSSWPGITWLRKIHGKTPDTLLKRISSQQLRLYPSI